MIYVAILALILSLFKIKGDSKKESIYNKIPKWNTYVPDGWEPANEYRVNII